MKRYLAVALVALFFSGVPCQAQFLQNLEKGLLGGQGQGQQPQPVVVGNVNLPPGQYLMTNVQSGQAFYVAVQNGQMFLTGQPAPPQMMAPGQGYMQQPGQVMMQPQQMMAPGQGMMQPQQPSGMGGLIERGLGGFLKNEMAPQQQVPGQ